jgi:hypothetical protein
MQLYERTSNDVLVKDTQFADARYTRDLVIADTTDKNYHIRFPEDTDSVLKGDRRDYGYKFKSEVFRRSLLHGLAIYNHQIGDRMHETKERSSVQIAIHKKNRKHLIIINHVNEFKFDGHRGYSVNLNEDLGALLELAMDDASIEDNEKFLAYLYMISKLTDDGWKDYHEDWKPAVEDMKTKLELRISMLNEI